MSFQKTVLADLPYCYATCQVDVDGSPHYIFGTDDKGPCYDFDAESGERQTVCEGPGDTMSIVPLPGHDGEFLASQRFLPVFAGREATIVRASRDAGAWRVEPWVDMPYVHRFDILQRNGNYYFLGCILSLTTDATADFNVPGGLLAAELDEFFTPPERFEEIAGGMRHNHGYSKFRRDGYDCGLTACDEGVFEVIPPARPGEQWQVVQVLGNAASDAVYLDIDGDGEVELATIEPFHGTDFVIYRREGGEFVPIYRHPDKMAFVHAIWGGELDGEPSLIAGYRGLAEDLFLLRWRNGEVHSEVIEHGGGPSNVTVVDYDGHPRLLVANRESHEAVLFDLVQEEK